MPLVIKETKKKRAGAGVASPEETALPSDLDYSLPEEQSEPAENITDYIFLLYGEKKIGKTSLMARFPNCLQLMFEPGAKGLKSYNVEVKSWEHFVGLINTLEKDTRFQMIVIDTIDEAYSMCFDYTCEKNNMVHPGLVEDYGTSWSYISKEFTKQFRRLTKINKGLWFISHGKRAEIKRLEGTKYNTILPSMPGQAFKYISALSDVIAYYGYVGNKRELSITGNNYINAGCRLENNFRTPDGEIIESIDMGKSPEDSYNAIMNAFNNTHKEVGGGIKNDLPPEKVEEDE